MFKPNQLFIVTFIIVLLVSALGLQAVSAKGSVDDYRDRAKNAASVLTEIMQIPEGGIPNDLMNRAHAIAVIPHVVKGAFGVGGEYGKGLVSTRLENGRWSTPAFINIGGGSFGLQLGVQATDLVLIFTDREGFRGLLDGKVKSPVLAYSRSKGLFAGISLDGAVVSINDSANKKVYGKEITAQDILYHGKARMNDIVSPFVQALEKYSPVRKRISD